MVHVVRSQSDHGSQSQSIGEENLSCSINPDTRVSQFGEVRCHVELDTIQSSIQSDASEEEDGEEEVGEESSEVDNLASPFDTFPDAEVAENPGNTKSQHKLQAETTGLLNLNIKM